MSAIRILVVISLLAASVAHAQEVPPAPAPVDDTIAVVGRVIDALGRPVPGATISLENEGGPLGTTDPQGRYQVRARIGATLVINAATHAVGLVSVTGETLDDIVLLAEAQPGETIEIKGVPPATAAGGAKLGRDELQRVPGTGGDIVRALTVMPGVVNLQIPLGFTGVVIRGSSPQDSKILIDDFEMPLLFHAIGFRSIVPAESIESLDFLPGGFDVAYGHATSGVVLLKTRGGSERRTTQAEISAIDGGLLAQGPLGKDKKTRYAVAFRRSMIDLIVPAVLPDDIDLSLTTVPRYYDAQLRIDSEFTPHWRGMLSAIATDDIFEVLGSKNEDAGAKRFFNRTRFARVTAAAKYTQGPWRLDAAISTLLPQQIWEVGLFQHQSVTAPQVTPRAELTRTEAHVLGLTNVEVRAGAEAQITRTHLDVAVPVEPREGEDFVVVDPRDTSVTVDDVIWTQDVATWLSTSADVGPRARVSMGLRAEYFARPRELALQPRGEVQFKLAPAWKLRLTAGSYTRPPEFQSELLSDTAGAERSTQTILGLQYEPAEGTRVQASTYYTDRTRLLRNTDMGLANIGRGTTYGAELLATYRGGPWFTWLSYSYSHSTRSDSADGMERLFDWDQPHSLNAAASWKRGRWQLGGRFQVYSGLPRTPVVGSVLDSDRNLYVPRLGPTNSDRAPIHHQLDLRIDYSWRWGPSAMTAFIDVQNVYLNDSLITYFYNYDFSQQIAFKSLPIIPSLGLRGVL